jgi:ATP-dependent Lon protease
MSGLLPLFPLQLVVFPGTAVPLHIFEPRYREMVGEAAASGSEFGIVLAPPAQEGRIVDTGCTVLVERILHRHPDGRFDVLTRGQRRFRVTGLNEEKDYLRGAVEYFADEDLAVTPVELREKALHAFGQLRDEPPPDLNDPLLSFRLADAIDDLDFKNVLQRSRSESERLRQLVEFVHDYIPRLEYSARMKRLAPLNGSGHKRPEM